MYWLLFVETVFLTRARVRGVVVSLVYFELLGARAFVERWTFAETVSAWFEFAVEMILGVFLSDERSEVPESRRIVFVYHSYIECREDFFLEILYRIHV